MHLRVAEVYGNKAYDLLRDGGVRARTLAVKERQGRDEIEGLSDHVPGSEAEALALVRQARKRAEKSATALNSNSSRGHTFWMIELQETLNGEDARVSDAGGAGPTGRNGGGVGNGRDSHRPRACRNRRLWIVDMAGSERILRSRANGQEASHINQDHTALFKCLQQTEEGGQRVSYRDRMLTRMLKQMFVREADVSLGKRGGGGGGLGGNSAAASAQSSSSASRACAFVMLVNVNPAASEYGETQKVLHNSLISLKARPNEKRALQNGPAVTYGPNGHLIKRQKTDHSFCADDSPDASEVSGIGKRGVDAPEPGTVHRTHNGLLREAENRIAQLEAQLREADRRAHVLETEAREEVQEELIPVIEKLEVRVCVCVRALNMR